MNMNQEQVTVQEIQEEKKVVVRVGLQKMQSMTNEQKKGVSIRHGLAILQFLASGEQFTTITNASALLKVSESSSRRVLERLVRDGFLKVDKRIIGYGKPLNLYGITQSAIDYLEIMVSNLDFEFAKAYRVGRFETSHVHHHQTAQAVHSHFWNHPEFYKGITAPEIYSADAGYIGKPDLILWMNSNQKIAIEVELNVKTVKRMQAAVRGHLINLYFQQYTDVWYMTPSENLEYLKKVFWVAFSSLGEKIEYKHDESVKRIYLKNFIDKFRVKELTDFSLTED